MHPSCQSVAKLVVRRLVVSALAFLIPLQGMAAGLMTVIGPAHTHRAAGSTLVLDDLRRAPVHAASSDRHVAKAFGHFHGAAERHHHGRDDQSVTPLGGDPWQHAGDTDEASLNPALSAFLALLSSPAVALPPAPRDAPALHAAWPALTHDPEPLERPPRRG